MEKNKDEEGVDLATKSLGGALDESQIGAEIMGAAEKTKEEEKREKKQKNTQKEIDFTILNVQQKF